MDFINEDEIWKKIGQPLLDKLKSEVLPSTLDGLESRLRSVLDGATVTITINLRPRS